MMIKYPKEYDELMDKCEKYNVPVWNDDHTEILDLILDPDAPVSAIEDAVLDRDSGDLAGRLRSDYGAAMGCLHIAAYYAHIAAGPAVSDAIGTGA